MKRSTSPDEWMSERVWRQVKHSVSIPCVDVILENSQGAVLLGWRKIPPYCNVWATPGGRMGRGENLRNAANRIISEYGLTAANLFLVGVFPVKFSTRADVTICLASNMPSGNAVADGYEFSSFNWARNIPAKTGGNYLKMIRKWRRLERNLQVLSYLRIH